jgi:CDP-diacylglycerol---serine O-phosphatidyltransferase
MSKTRFIVPNIFTSLNFLLGVWSICWSGGLFTPNDTSIPWYAYAMSGHFIIFCTLLDKLDGFAARLMNASSEFGAQFDSLADLIAFGIAPAFALLFAYRGLAPDWYHAHTPTLVVVLSLYVLCAAMRLAKYNAMDSDSYPDYFSGMPTTFAGGFNAVALVLLCKYGFFENHAELLHLPLLIMVFTAILMVSPLFLPKVKRRDNKFINVFQSANIIAGYVVGFSMAYTEYLLALLFIYFFAGFGYGVFKRDSIVNDQEAKVAERAAARA